ncbi:MAG TPA: ATP-binding protein [Polyangiaceae bacterium]|nr:ATP-binding protein [Polyangiaceae bacterium]
MSELRETQAQLIQSAKMASLGQFVAGIAHEINNPLAFVISHLDTVRRSLELVGAEVGNELSGDASEHWRRAQERQKEMAIGLERIRDLVIKLRTFSRMDDGSEVSRVSFREGIDSVLTILGHRLRNRIEVETHFGAPDQIECHAGLLNQALTNLIANAIDAMGERGTLTLTTAVQSGDYVITVGDTGCGIPQHLSDRVYEPFFTTKPVGRGTGLGLTIAYAIVRKHGGSLELDSAEGRGTVATIRLPQGNRHGQRDADGPGHGRRTSGREAEGDADD